MPLLESSVLFSYQVMVLLLMFLTPFSPSSLGLPAASVTTNQYSNKKGENFCNLLFIFNNNDVN